MRPAPLGAGRLDSRSLWDPFFALLTGPPLKLSPTLTTAEIRSSVEVLAAESRPDIGDPFKWQDYAGAFGSTVEVLHRRLDDGRTPRRGQVFRWPKEKGSEYRPMAWLDPIDQLIYRAAIGRVVHPIAAAMDSDSVISFSLAQRRMGWEMEDWRRRNPARRKRAKELLSRHHVMGAIDVKGFYPSIRRSALESVLGELPLHAPTVEFILGWLDTLDSLSGIKGLPTGPDASGILAHAVLLPLDAMLTRLRVPYVRWVDDTWFFVDDLAEYESIIEAYRRELGLLGLELHPTKTQPYLGFEALEVIESSAIQYFGETLNDMGSDGLAAAIRLFEFAMESPEDRKSELRRSLTALTKHRDLTALNVLKSDTDLLRLGIPHWVAYLRNLLVDKGTRRAVGDDWLLDQITRPVTKDHGYSNLCFLRASSHIQLKKAEGKQVFDLACSEGGWSAPVRVWAAHNWGRSDDFSAGTAVEQVEEQGEYSTRRAFACTLASKRGTLQMPALVQRIRRAEPELAPTAGWLEAA